MNTPTKRTMRLQPIAMVAPTIEGVYAPSRIHPAIEISLDDFEEHWRFLKRPILVSLSLDGYSNPKIMDTYKGYILK